MLVTGRGRVVATGSRLLFESLASVYAGLGFDALGDEVFRDVVIARIVEPTAVLDSGRVLSDLGVRAGELLDDETHPEQGQVVYL